MVTAIKNKRKKIGLSQAELANRLGISRPTFVKIERGERNLKKIEKEKLEVIFNSFDAERQNQSIRINIPQKNIEKFKQVFLYIIQKVGAKPNVGMTVLYKLLYFIDFDYYEKYEEQLMGLTYFKNTHGPAPREFKKIVDRMKKDGELEEIKSKFYIHEQKKFLPHKDPDLLILSGQELEMVDSVLDRYSDKTAKELSDMTHRDIPWKVTKDKKNIDYEFAFYRKDEFSVREYEEL